MKGKQKESDQLCTLYYLVAKLAEALGEAPIRNKVWTHKVDDHWFIKINGHPETVDGIPPYCLFVEFNGFPAGCMTPFEGSFAAGSAANEDEFIRVMKEKLTGLGVNLEDLREVDVREKEHEDHPSLADQGIDPEEWAEKEERNG